MTAGSRRTTTSRSRVGPRARCAALGDEPVTPSRKNIAEDSRARAGLDADAVRPLDVAADEGPHDADEEHDAGGVADERIALVHAAVEELPGLRHLVVDLETVVTREEDEEAEVDAASA